MSTKLNKLSTHYGVAFASSIAVLAGVLTFQTVVAREPTDIAPLSITNAAEASTSIAPEEVVPDDPADILEPSVAEEEAIKEDEGGLLDEVVVLGVKRNLMSAQAIKRDASTMVDAISSEDIGLLPDYSVLDAMQRIPGIALERFASSNDPDHFSTESTGITIRGMKQSRSEFNGRDTFTANQGRSLSYQDVPPELMSSIEVYKNQTADMIEGGIGGTVTLRTRKPFDSDERAIAFNIDLSYGDIAQEMSPTFSGLFSDTFSTDVGEFGVLFNYVESTLYGESHGIQSATYLETYAKNLVVEDDPLGDPGEIGARVEDFIGDDKLGTVWVPSSANVLMKEDEHKRKGIAAVLQYQNNDETLKTTLEYIRSDSDFTWTEKAIKYAGGYHNLPGRKMRPLAGTYFTFDENGLFQEGIITRDEPWRAGGSSASRVPQSPANKDFPQWGHITQMDSRVNDLSSLVEDTSFKVEWHPSDRLELIGDVQYVKAKTANDDVSVHTATWMNTQYNATGSLPVVHFLDPWMGRRDTTRANDLEEGGLDDNIWDAEVDGVPSFPGFGGDLEGDQNYFQDVNSYLWRSAMDHYERSDGDSIALRLDGTYDIDHSFVKSISTGIRYAERQQVVRSTSWNWGALAPEWSGRNGSEWSVKPAEVVAEEIAFEEAERGGPLTDWEKKQIEINGERIGWVSDIEEQLEGIEYVDWSDFMGGGVAHIPGNQTIHASEGLIRSVMGANPSRYLRETPVTSGNWQPYPTREGLDAKYGLFHPEDINTTTETRNALYLKLDFGGDADLVYSGNIGVRYVTMERVAEGEIVFPDLSPATYKNTWADFPVPDELSLPLDLNELDEYFRQQVLSSEFDYRDFRAAALSGKNNWVGNAYYYLPEEQLGFGAVKNDEGEYEVVSQVVQSKTDYSMLLPSFNIKVDITDDWVGRFAFAKSVAFPDMGDVRNRTTFAAVDRDNVVEVRRTVEEDGDEVSLLESAYIPVEEGELLWGGEGGNPFMKPMESVQYDISLEWYFSEVGQLSTAIFHKNLSNYFAPGVIYREFTHPVSGITETTAITSNRNAGDAKLDGVELTYQQFFEGLFDGFGIQATYTYVDANSVPNNDKNVEDEQWFGSPYEDTGIRVNYDKLPLEGQSDHIVNLVGMYENTKWSARLSYNWRSKYLITTRDVITKAPQMYDDHGELDGSIFYNITDHFTIGLQAKNMTNATSKTLTVLNDELLETGRSWFVSDRRIALVLSGSF